MRKYCISFLIVAIIILSGIGLTVRENEKHTEYLRVHVRAASNDEKDQAVKYKVKDAVVEYLTPFIVECDSKEKAQTLLTSRLSGIEEVADRVLQENGYTYKSKAQVKKEQFPTRVYDDVELESGIYDALIIELGEGKGDNWWCVVYPPLCFTGKGVSYVYKSKISEIIDGFFNKERKA